MVTDEDIVNINLIHEDVDMIKRESIKACLGGKSTIFNPDERNRRLLFDQVTGQIGNLAINIFIHGRDFGIKRYQESRDIINQNPWQGDDGRDIIDLNIDIKTSCLHNDNFNMLYARLAVRPHELKPDWIYVLGIVYEKYKHDTSIMMHLVGWANSSDFPNSTENSGPFAGAYIITAKNLRTMKELDEEVCSE
jgi:hypothetical protein